MASNVNTQKAQTENQKSKDKKPLSQEELDFRITAPEHRVDLVTIGGLFVAIGLIGVALVLGGTPQAFFNIPALFIVVGGTMAVAAISCSTEELGKLRVTIASTLNREIREPKTIAQQILGLAVISRKKGLLSIANLEDKLKQDPEFMRSIQFVIDGFNPKQIQNILQNELDSMVERSRRSAAIIRRASEVAPAMGLIGTLVGLVQMLAQLDNPDAIGPAMAIALLTTFYGALLGTVILGPLAAKVERNANQDALVKTILVNGMVAIASQENPRELEIQFNALLPPDQQLAFFD